MSETKTSRKPASSRSKAAHKASAGLNQAAGSLGQAKSLLGDASSVVEHVQSVKEHWEERAKEVAQQSPYLALLGAGGAGFVLGGGLSIALTRRLWLVGGRIAISLALQRLTQGSLLGSSSQSDA